jgi:hypothetical protein
MNIGLKTVHPWTEYVRFYQIYLEKLPDMSGPSRNFLLNIDS